MSRDIRIASPERSTPSRFAVVSSPTQLTVPKHNPGSPAHALQTVQRSPLWASQPDAILALQQTIGNRAVQRLLQPASPPITSVPQSHKRIQRSGLASLDSLIAYAKTLEAMRPDDNPKALGQEKPPQPVRDYGVALVKFVREQLAKVHVPYMYYMWEDLPEGAAGAFRASNWTMILNQSATYTSKSNFDDLASTIYHESRHCEQHFKTLQLFASMGLNKASIKKVTRGSECEDNVIDAAIQHQSDAKSWGANLTAMVKRWYEAKYDLSFDDAVRDAGTDKVSGDQTTHFTARERRRKLFEAVTKEESDQFNRALSDFVRDQGNPETMAILRAYANKLQSGMPEVIETYITEVMHISSGNSDEKEKAPTTTTAHRRQRGEARLFQGQNQWKDAEAAKSKVLSHIESLKRDAEIAKGQYFSSAHEADAYGTEDKLKLTVKAIQKSPPKPPELPSDIRKLAGEWKTRITIPKLVVGHTSGGRNIGKITAALQLLIPAYEQACSTNTLMPLLEALFNLMEASDDWLEKKKGSKKESTAKRSIPVSELNAAAKTYYQQVKAAAQII